MARFSAFPRSAGALLMGLCLGATIALGDEKKEFSEEAFLEAAYNNCTTFEQRGPKSCECEQKLMRDPDRMSREDKEMAYYYWADKERYIKEFQARKAADPNWQKAFAERMANVQALVISACGM